MDFNQNQPIYIQIVDYFCDNILSGKWQEHEKIPSVRDIAVTVEVNPNTAIRAYTVLQDKGVIFNKRGLGYFVAEGGKQRVLDMKKEEFFSSDLPPIFKSMVMLGITPAEIEKKFAQYQSEQSL